MKRRLSRRKSTSRRRVTRRSGPVLTLRRITIIGSLFGLLFFVVLPNRHIVTQSVQGASIFRGMYAQATVIWDAVPGAVSYNIYYKEPNDTSYSHSVQKIPSNMTSYTIAYLKKNVSYTYRISAVNTNGAEFWWSPTNWLNHIEPM